MPTDYHNVRQMQARLARIRTFRDGELLEKFNLPSVRRLAERIEDKFFHKAISGNLAVRDDQIKMLMLLIVLAPILQRERNAYRIDWHRGHLLNWIRRHANRRIRRFWIHVSEIPRIDDVDVLRMNLLEMGIGDKRLIEDVIIDLFRAHYGLDVARGRLANVLFDGVMFYRHDRGGYSLRVGNRFIRLEKEPFEGAMDLRADYATIWDYRLHHVVVPSGGKFNILVSPDRIQRFRDEIKSALRASTTPAYRVCLLDRVIREFIDDAKFAKSAFFQIAELSRWLRQKTRSLAGTDRRARELPALLMNRWKEKAVDRFYVNKPNFFWDSRRVPEEVYINFFSPYRVW